MRAVYTASDVWIDGPFHVRFRPMFPAPNRRNVLQFLISAAAFGGLARTTRGSKFGTTIARRLGGLMSILSVGPG